MEGSLPSRGKLLQQHKAELRVLRTEAKRVCAKAKSKEERAAAEAKYSLLEQQLLQQQHQQLQQLAEAAAADSDVDSNKAEALQAAADAAAAAAAAAAAPNPSSPPNTPTAEKAVLETLEGLSLYKTTEGRKPSKAQRRREKKQQENRERERVFEEARAGGSMGETEWNCLSEALQQENLSIFSVPGDGNCLFRAIAHQLETNPSDERVWNPQSLRSEISEVLKKEKTLFQDFLDEDLKQDEAYEAFCENIKNSQDWGGEIELHAATKLLRRPIKVFSWSDSVKVLTYGEEFGEAPPLRLVFHRYLLASGPHYNSVLQQDPTSDTAS